MVTAAGFWELIVFVLGLLALLPAGFFALLGDSHGKQRFPNNQFSVVAQDYGEIVKHLTRKTIEN